MEFALRDLVYRQTLEIENPSRRQITAIQDHQAECFPDNGPRYCKPQNNPPWVAVQGTQERPLCKEKTAAQS